MLFSKKTEQRKENTASVQKPASEPKAVPAKPAAILQEDTKNSPDDGKFEIEYKEDGVYLSLILPKGKGKKVSEEECLAYLKRKGFYYLPVPDIEALFESGAEDTIRISEPMEEKILGEELVLEVENGKMAAYLEILPPDPGGETLSKEQIIENLKQKYGIIFGIDEAAIGDLTEKKAYGERVLIARGKAPVNGKDGALQFHFSEGGDGQKEMKVSEDGKVDFRNINSIQNVTIGQTLVTRVPASAGEEGMDIQGNPLRAQKGKEVALPMGKNVIASDDKLTLTAKMSGSVTMNGGRIEISPLYTVRGNVDMSVGNIHFEGDVLVIGNVNSGFSVKAAGSITVNGIVEDASLEAGKDIALKRGIQGADKGTLKAGGNIYALFIQRASVEAEGSIYADFIFHSKVKCEGDLEITGKNGLLVGGSADVGKSLVAKTIGADSGIQTNVKLGISPRIRERLTELDESLKQIRMDMRRMDVALKSSIGKMSGASNTAARIELTKKMLSLKQEEVDMVAEYNKVAAEMEKAKEGSVHVLGTVFGGTKIIIGTAQYSAKSEEVFVTYQNREGIIDAQPCKYSIQDKKSHFE